MRRIGYTHWETFLYHGDEIEVSSVSATYETKKTLTCLSDIVKPEKLIFALTLKTNDSDKKASLALYIDGVLKLEWDTNSTEYELKKGTVEYPNFSFTEGLHRVEVKVKAEDGAIAYNQLFEVYYSLRK